MNQNAAKFDGSIPEHYDHGLGPHIFEEYASDLAGRVASRSPQAVLELAAGTGIVTRKLRDALPEACELVASDLNGPMLEIARTKFEAGENVRFEEIDAMAIAYDDARFDTLACQFGVMFFPDKPASFVEARRVLRPGGEYVFSTWESWAANPFAERAHRVVERFFPDDPPGFYRVPFHYHDIGEIRAAVEGAGFERVTVEHVPVESKILCADRFATGLVFGNPLHDEILERGGKPERVRDAIRESIEEFGDTMPLQAIVVHATAG